MELGQNGQHVFGFLQGRGWILCDSNDNFLGITRVPVMMLTFSGVLINSPGFNLHIQNKTRSI